MRSGDVLAGRFVIDHLAGRGGMGEVFRAWDQQTNQNVAIKILRGDAASDLARFEREVRILSQIDDPCIVQYIAHGAAPSGEPYLAMEWLEGEDLGKRLARGRLSNAESVRLCATIAGALGRLHERGIVHRDLKPSNLFLIDGRTTGVKVLDFGIARIESSTFMTGTGTLVGTFGYMAPEQANGTKDIDARADIFALGCVLFECIAGEPAFGGPHPMAVLTKILFEDTPRLSDLCTGIPIELETLVSRMLSKNRAERYGDGHAVADALRALENIPDVVGDDTLDIRRPSALTHSELRTLAVILVSAPATGTDAFAMEVAAVAQAHGATVERLLDGSLAMVLSSKGVATDLAIQGARCALAVAARTSGRRVVLAVGRAQTHASLPMGAAIDQAGRLMGINAPERNFVVIDDSAAGLLDARFDVRDESGVYVLAGERDVVEVRTLLGKRTPCVGRERELRMLEGLFDDCTGDEPRAVAMLVTAPPGVGKSRLGREFLRAVSLRRGATSVWIARGEPLRAGSAFALASQLVESAAGIQRGEPPEVRREKLRARVAQHVPEPDQRRVTDFLGEMINASFSDEGNLPLRVARSDAQVMNEQLRLAFREFLAAECASKTVLVVLEDLHWGDGPTVEILGRLLRDLSEKSLFVLALARPTVHEVFPALWGNCSMQEIRMSELSKTASERLVRHVLGAQVDAETVQKVVDLSSGNAFYLEELIRATVEGRGKDLPSTVVSMVQSRIGALSDSERRLLRAASIFGETCWTGSVATLLGFGAQGADGDPKSQMVKLGDTSNGGSKVDEKLRLLVDKEFLIRRTESRFPAENEYAFRHALLREGAYSMLTEEDRVLGHRLAGEWLERMGENDPVVLAEHFEHGGHHEKASQSWYVAGHRAGWSGHTEESIRHVERALQLQPPPALRQKILGLYCELHIFRVELAARALEQARELLRTAERGSEGWAQAQLIAITCAAQTGDLAAFQQGIAEAMMVEAHARNAHGVAILLGMTTGLLDLGGQIPLGSQVFGRLDALLHSMEVRAPVAEAFLEVMRVFRMLYAHEDLLRGFVLAKATVQPSRAIGHFLYASGVHVIAALYAFALGAHHEAIAMIDEQTDTDSKLGIATSLKPFVLGWALADIEAFPRAREWAERLVNTARSRQLPFDEARGHWILAEVLRRMGDFDTAESEIQTALAMLRLTCPLDVPGALATLATMRLAQNRPHDALAAAEVGMSKMAAMSGACSQFFRNAFLRLAHAESLKACGRHADAITAIQHARDWITSVAAKIDDDQYKNSFLESVPENRKILELAEQWEA